MPFQRISVNLKPEQVTALQKRAADTGVPQSEQIRRAIDAALTPPTKTPVLFAPKVETRNA
ncbi:MAG: ribbon-helix-helix domain-containing protein [Terriglobales bacterium]